MKLPRDISGRELIVALNKLGYEVTRLSGSHVRLTTERNGTHHINPGTPAHQSRNPFGDLA